MIGVKTSFVFMIIVSLLLCIGSFYEYLTLEDLGKAEIIETYVYYRKNWHYQGINYKINDYTYTTIMPFGSLNKETIEKRNDQIIIGSKENIWKSLYSEILCYNSVTKERFITEGLLALSIASFFACLLM